MTGILAVCIEMENSVIVTESHDWRNVFLKKLGWSQFHENVNINFTIKEECLYWAEFEN